MSRALRARLRRLESAPGAGLPLTPESLLQAVGAVRAGDPLPEPWRSLNLTSAQLLQAANALGRWRVQP